MDDRNLQTKAPSPCLRPVSSQLTGFSVALHKWSVPVCAKKEKAGAAHAPAAKVPEEHTSPALCGNITETSNNNNIESGQNDREVVINSSGDPMV